MERLRAVWVTIQRQLAALSVTQRLLIASLCVVLLMTLFLVSQYAGSAKMVELAPGLLPEQQAKVVTYLSAAGIPSTTTNGKIMVPVERQYPALAQLAKAQLLPTDKKLMFAGIMGQQNWLMPQSQMSAMHTLALGNELAAVIKNFSGIEDASVTISIPETRGIGAAVRKPVAQVTVFPAGGTALDQKTVNALADLVGSSVAGLDMREVAVIDGVNNRSHRAVSPDDLAIGGTYMEQVAKVEGRIKQKIEESLAYIDNVIVSVNAIVDGAKRSSREVRVLNKGDGTVVLPVEETTTNGTSTNTSKARPGEPGLGSNVTMDINTSGGGGGGGGGGSSTVDESTTVKSEARFGERVVTQSDPSGRPTKINVSITIPRNYVAQIIKQRKASSGEGKDNADKGAATTPPSEPTEQEILAEWEAATGTAGGAGGAGGGGGLKAKLEEMLQPLVETESGSGGGGSAASQVMAGTVRAYLMPVAMVGGIGKGAGGVGGLGGAGDVRGAGSGFIGSLSSTLGGNMVKTVALGALAVLAIGLMLMMVRKSTATGPLPTAEELVGLPPALQTGSDIVGEAEEGETAMTGIEVDASSLKTGKMLEEISTLVSSNPTSAAQVFNRWLSSEN